MSRLGLRGTVAASSLALTSSVVALVGTTLTAPGAHAAPPPRPTEDIYQSAEQTPVCGADACVHYAQDGTNDVPTEDDGAGGAWNGEAGNGIPDYVDLVAGSLLPKMATVFAGGGYAAPLGDGTAGGDAKVDFYLADLEGVAGGAYCVSENPGPVTASAGFCVLDNDYSAAEYGTRLSPAANLGLDVAHRYAHLVHLAVSQVETWIEAFGAWAEDEIYPTLDRNRAYLATSPLRQPGVSMIGYPSDHSAGRWIFLRYLSERYPAEVGTLPSVVRDVITNGEDAALASRGTTMRRAFTEFTTWNRAPASHYAEGAAYPTAPLAGNVMLSGVTRKRTFDGLARAWTSHSFRFRPSATLKRGWRIKIDTSSLGALGTSDKAVVATFKAKGRAPATRVLGSVDAARLTSTITLAFTTSVEWVEVRIVTGECSEASNPSETGEPAYDVVARVFRA